MNGAPRVVDNPDAGRYEIEVDGQIAFLDYRLRNGQVLLAHTEVPEALRGRGLANILATHAMDVARASSTPVVIRCPFVTSWLRRHPEYNDLVVARLAEDRDH